MLLAKMYEIGGADELMSELVTIAAYLKPWEAHILRGRLEAENIFATVLDEYTTANYGTDTGTRVQVRKEDVARALEIVREAESQRIDPRPG